MGTKSGYNARMDEARQTSVYRIRQRRPRSAGQAGHRSGRRRRNQGRKRRARKAGREDLHGRRLASFVYSRDHVVAELNGDRAVITYGGVTVAAVRVSDLVLADGSGAGGTIKAGSVVRVKQGAKTYTAAGWPLSCIAAIMSLRS